MMRLPRNQYEGAHIVWLCEQAGIPNPSLHSIGFDYDIEKNHSERTRYSIVHDNAQIDWLKAGAYLNRHGVIVINTNEWSLYEMGVLTESIMVTVLEEVSDE